MSKFGEFSTRSTLIDNMGPEEPFLMDSNEPVAEQPEQPEQPEQSSKDRKRSALIVYGTFFGGFTPLFWQDLTE